MAKEEQKEKDAGEVYNKFLRLYERFTSETIEIGRQGEALGKIIENLKAESLLATEFKVEVRKGIKESVDKAVEEVNSKIRSSIQELVTKEVSEKVKGFEKAMEDAKKLLITYAVETSLRKYWIYLIVLFFGCIAYFTAATYRQINKCNPGSRFGEEQLSTYRIGVMCEGFWDKLSKKTRDRLLSIKDGKTPAEENSYEWIREKNPKLDNKALKKRFDELNGV